MIHLARRREDREFTSATIPLAANRETLHERRAEVSAVDQALYFLVRGSFADPRRFFFLNIRARSKQRAAWD